MDGPQGPESLEEVEEKMDRGLFPLTWKIRTGPGPSMSRRPWVTCRRPVNSCKVVTCSYVRVSQVYSYEHVWCVTSTRPYKKLTKVPLCETNPRKVTVLSNVTNLDYTLYNTFGVKGLLSDLGPPTSCTLRLTPILVSRVLGLNSLRLSVRTKVH